MIHEKSKQAFQRARQCIPGGVNSPARAFGAVGGTPPFLAQGEGPRLVDIDGNRYLDYVGSWGPLILGHCHPLVVAAVQQALNRGTSFGAPTEAESELAELLIDAVESIEKVRLVNSGTEATMTAIRLARGYTGRDLIIKFSGNYHGHVDSLLVAAGSAAATLGAPNSPGVTAGTAKDTIILPYNNPQTLADAFERHGDQIAGVILEPVVGNMGCIRGSDEFLSTARDLTHHHGTVLIFDEVMSGFRVAYGGVQSVCGITPDLTTLGKIIGGGLPVGAYGGKTEIMDAMLPVGKVFQAGTLSGNPLATAAGIATLQILRDESPYATLEARTTALVQGLASAAAENDIPHFVSQAGAMATFFFSERPVTNWESASHCDTKRFSRFFWGMLDRGHYFPCSQYEAFFLSTAHSDADVASTIAAAEETFRAM